MAVVMAVAEAEVVEGMVTATVAAIVAEWWN